MAGDWVKLHRKLNKSDLWLSEEFTRGQAWVDLILMAAFRPGFIRLRGVRVGYDRGQLATAERFLCERWKWSRGKVRRFLDELETAQQIVQQKSNASTVITITNYESYQGGSTADSTANGTTNGTADGPQTGQQTDQIKERQELKKVKKDKKVGGFTPPTAEQVAAYCRERKNAVPPARFIDFYETRGWKLSSGVAMKDWKAAVRTWETNGNGPARGSPARPGFNLGPGHLFDPNSETRNEI